MNFSMKIVQGALRGWHTVESQELAFEVESVYLLLKGTPIPRLFKNHIRAKLNIDDINNIVHSLANFYFGKWQNDTKSQKRTKKIASRIIAL